MGGKIAGAELALFFTRNSEKQDRSCRLSTREVQRSGNFENCCNAGRIVHCAIVNFVTIDWLTHTDVVEVRRQNYIFITSIWIPSPKNSSNILRFRFGVLNSCLGSQTRGEFEPWNVFTAVDERQ